MPLPASVRRPQTHRMSDDPDRVRDSARPIDARPIDARLARDLVDTQFPQWADEPITGVPVGGVDNRTFRLGADLSVRLPSADWYADQVAKEQRWLPVLGPQLPLPVPVPVARGVPGSGYPYSWSVYRWLEGETAAWGRIADQEEFARALVRFLRALGSLDTAGGPPPGPHNFFRGGPLTTYDEETHRAIETLRSRIPAAAAEAVWADALATTWVGPPVWFHGDVAEGNLLVRDGRLAAVIDFGCCGVGDPACDVVVAWTLFSGASRAAFRAELGVDPATWARGRGWALWKALISIAAAADSSELTPDAWRVLGDVLADHAAGDPTRTGGVRAPGEGAD